VGTTVLAFSIAAVSALTAFADDRAESLVRDEAAKPGATVMQFTPIRCTARCASIHQRGYRFERVAVGQTESPLNPGSVFMPRAPGLVQRFARHSSPARQRSSAGGERELQIDATPPEMPFRSHSIQADRLAGRSPDRAATRMWMRFLAEAVAISAKIMQNAAQHNAIIRNAATRSGIGFAADTSISLHCMKLRVTALNRKFLGGSLCG